MHVTAVQVERAVAQLNHGRFVCAKVAGAADAPRLPAVVGVDDVRPILPAARPVRADHVVARDYQAARGQLDAVGRAGRVPGPVLPSDRICDLRRQSTQSIHISSPSTLIQSTKFIYLAILTLGRALSNEPTRILVNYDLNSQLMERINKTITCPWRN